MIVTECFFLRQIATESNQIHVETIASTKKIASAYAEAIFVPEQD